MEKNEIYFNEYNVLMNNAIYLPLVSGQLQAFAQIQQEIKENYEFKPQLFMRDRLENIICKYNNPAIAAFSVSMWNENLNLAVAREVKMKFPNTLIVMGGPQIPFKAEDYLRKNNFIDFVVYGEGERTFTELLGENIRGKNWEKIKGISYIDKSGKYRKNLKRIPENNPDNFPSPYLEGVFDSIMASNNIDFQAIIETNRGCPYSCAYCFWGQSDLEKKVKCFSQNRIEEVAEWCGKNEIKYVFCADANFGIFKRDLEIAKFFVKMKQKYGFPEKFRAAYAKNSEKTVYEIGKLLNEQDMQKGITLSRQTNNMEASINVNRKNINMSVYSNLQKKYSGDNIPTYTEMILGLPGETYQSFIDGLENIMESGLKNQIIVYPCQVYPNTQLADKAYQEKFGIATKRIHLQEAHSFEREQGLLTEYEEIIIGTSSMPSNDWKKSTVFSYALQLFHGLRAGTYLLGYLKYNHNVKYTDFLEYLCSKKAKNSTLINNEIDLFNAAAESVLQGKPQNKIVHGTDLIYWKPEEISFLNISDKKNEFYDEFLEVTKEYMGSINKNFDESQLREVMEYQKLRFPSYKPINDKEFNFKYNFPEYFDAFFNERGKIEKKSQILSLIPIKDYQGDKRTFAREIIIFGRNSDKILYPVQFK